MSSSLEIQLIAVLVAIACALPGCFLILRKLSMIAESITHTILLGVVLAFFMTNDINSPYLIVGAGLTGVVTVWLIELLNKSKLLSGDSSIGIVFPLFFSIAVILISKYAGKVHLCAESILMGELAFAPFDRLIINGYDCGAMALYVTGGLLLFNILLIFLFFKELTLASFDPILAAVLGLSPVLLHYLLMTMVSVTSVVAFQSVGSVLVLAFMIAPPVTAYLMTDHLKHMLILSGVIAALNAVLGYHVADYYGVSISGSMAMMSGFSFLVIFLLSPQRGLISAIRRRKLQRLAFAKATLLFHLHEHESVVEANLAAQLNWSPLLTQDILKSLKAEKKIEAKDGCLSLTPLGEQQGALDYESYFLYK